MQPFPSGSERISQSPEAQRASETFTGQSRWAYQVAAGIMLFDELLSFLLTEMSPLILLAFALRALLAIGLFRFSKLARTLTLAVSVFGAIGFSLMSLSAGGDPHVAAVNTIGVLCYNLPIILVLTGESRSWRLPTAVALYIVGNVVVRIVKLTLLG